MTERDDSQWPFAGAGAYQFRGAIYFVPQDMRSIIHSTPPVTRVDQADALAIGSALIHSLQCSRATKDPGAPELDKGRAYPDLLALAQTKNDLQFRRRAKYVFVSAKGSTVTFGPSRRVRGGGYIGIGDDLTAPLSDPAALGETLLRAFEASST